MTPARTPGQYLGRARGLGTWAWALSSGPWAPQPDYQLSLLCQSLDHMAALQACFNKQARINFLLKSLNG